MEGDAPKIVPQDDGLGRTEFAKLLADSIIKLKVDAGFVYGLYGEWGVGKSTILNFVEHHITEHNKTHHYKRVVVLRFNPWMFSSSEKIVAHFFEQLQLVLKIADGVEILKKAVQWMGRLETGLTIAQPFLSKIPIISTLIDQLKAAKSALNDEAEAMQLDIHGQRQKIIEAMQKQPHKILVMVDDVDRLFPQEIRDLMRMIKAVCDFPNMVFLLACEQDRVADALGNPLEKTTEKRIEDGRRFLEKIVQLELEVPEPFEHPLFMSAMEKFSNDILALEPDLQDIETTVIKKGEMVEEFKQQELPLIWALLKTPRHRIRLLNTMQAIYPLVKEQAYLYDFLIVQTLRIYAPTIYQAIKQKKLVQLKDNDYYYVLPEYYQELKKDPTINPNALELVHKIFFKEISTEGRMRSQEEGTSFGDLFKKGVEREAIQKAMVRQKNGFDIYFQLALSPMCDTDDEKERDDDDPA
ncbi:MAG: KAP family P-loop NTPase fold protein [Alphaproteobacteria bacterium]